MADIRVWTHDRVEDISAGQMVLDTGWTVHKKKNHIWIQRDSQVISVTAKGVRLPHENQHIQVMPNYTREWFIYSLQTEVLVGRDNDCDIQLSDSILSKRHFHIQNGILFDLKSTNGTYVNGIRIQKRVLQDGDHIVFGLHDAYYLSRYLILDTCCGEQDFPQEDPVLPLDWSLAPSVTVMEEPSIQTVTIESPQSEIPVQKGKWLHALGSSFLIMISGCMSALIVLIKAPQQADSLMTLLVQSISMAVAFGAYGLYHRHSTYKDKQKQSIQRKKAYQNYCQNWIQEQLQLKDRYEQEARQMREAFSLRMDNRYPSQGFLYIGDRHYPWLSVQFCKAAYHQVEDPLYRLQRQTIQSVPDTLLWPYFVKPGEICVFPKMNEHFRNGLFMQWALKVYTPMHKWVWVMDSKDVEQRFILHPGCQENGNALIVTNSQEWEHFLSQTSPCVEYTIWLEGEYVHPISQTGWTWLVSSPISYPQNLTYASLSDDDLVYRELMRYTQSANEMDFFSIYAQNASLFSIQPIRQSTVSLQVILGLDSQGQKIVLDLSEHHHGPHGFVAGTTGSGKSELLKSILFQLLVQNDPSCLQIILIDFKGGAFGQRFLQFAHCQGALTNLDRQDMERFLSWMHQFLEERQRLLQEFVEEYPEQIAHIDAYNSIHIEQPMAHVLLVVDELAQIKMNFPDLMNSLKETARIGRSLGLHCLLSTQKPLGVIDDQIWANSHFKICLSVSSPSDSYEVLHTDQAVSLHLPGEFLFQCLPNQLWHGQGWHLQQEMYIYEKGYTEVDESGRVLSEFHQKKEPIAEILCRQIETRKAHAPWIVPPFHQQSFCEGQWALIDDPKNRKLIPWTLESGQVTMILCKEKEVLHRWLISLKRQNDCPVYGLMIQDDFLDECFNERTFAQIQSIHSPCIWVVNLSLVKEKDLSLLKHPLVALVIVFHHVENTFRDWFRQASYRILLQTDSIQDAHLFLEGAESFKELPVFPRAYIVSQHHLYLILFCEQKGTKEKRFSCAYALMDRPDGFCLGWDCHTHRPIFWDMKHPLLIGYIQQSMQHHISSLLQDWQKQRPLKVAFDLQETADIYVIHVARQSHQLQGADFLSTVYDLDVLWVGKGAREYAYMLKRSGPSHDRCMRVAWIEDQIFELEKEI